MDRDLPRGTRVVALRLAWAVVFAAGSASASSKSNDDLRAYFDVAGEIWSDPMSSAAKCLAVQRHEGWRAPQRHTKSKSVGANFVTLGVEGAGHHWFGSLPTSVCGGGEAGRCGGLGSFSE